MKRPAALSVILILILSLSCSSSQSLTREQRKELKSEQMKEGLTAMKSLLESGTFVFTAQSVQPSGGRSIQLNSTMYTLASKEKMAKANLPYFGRSYASHYSSDPGIKFEGEMKEYSITENDKQGNITLSFKVPTAKENYDVKLTVSSSGYGSVTILSRDKQAISYYGELGEMSADYKF